MEQQEPELVVVPASLAADLREIVSEARELGFIVASLVNRAETTLQQFDQILSQPVRESDCAYSAVAESCGLEALFGALGTIADTASRI
jgi:hypothetical protein